MKKYIHPALVLVFAWLLSAQPLMAQTGNTDLPNPTPNLITAPAGTYVIAMDNALQSNPGFFNMKAYGLAVKILNQQKAIHWVIRSGKLKDQVDFSASATRVFPTAQSASMRDFKAGPLLILPRDSAGVAAIINGFNNAQTSANRVNVYQLTAPTVVDVRYILTQMPRGVVLNDGNNVAIHADYYKKAAVDSPMNWRVTEAVNLIGQCYTFASEPHSSVVGPTIDSIKSYVMRGGNFLAQCLAINTYENQPNGRFQTTGGITIFNSNTSPNFSHPNADLSFSQYEGRFDPNLIGGAEKNWRSSTGSAYHNNHHKHQCGGLPTDSFLIGQSVSKLTTGRGHLVFYTGGHDYDKNNTIDFVNGMRSFFNAFLTPSGLSQCDFLRFDNDLAITKTATPSTLCQGATTTFKVVVRNDGPTQTQTPVIAREIFPSSGFSITSATVNKGSFNQNTGVWNIGIMVNGESDTLTIIATATASGSFVNTAYLETEFHDYNQANDTASVNMNVSSAVTTTLPAVTGCGSYTLPWGQVVTTSGTYSNTVTGTNGCDSTVTVPVTINNVTATPTSTAVSCFGGSNGSVSVTPGGGTAPYSYLWNTGATTQTVTGRTAGTYTVTVTDAAGCTAVNSIAVTQPTLLVANSSSGSIACFGGSTTVVVTASGGTAPYTGTGTFTRTAGTYSFTVTDANGCTAVTSTTIAEPPVLIATSVATTIIVNGGTATVTVSASGGTAPYIGTGTFTETAGTYTYTVTDVNGCTASTTITLTQPDPLIPTATAPPVLCFGGSTTVTVTATGGVPPYTGTGTFVRTAGTYSFVVTDANGITATANITITEPTQVVASSSATAIACNGGNSTVTVTATGGTPAYTGTGTFTRTAGTYSFTVTDANGCTAITSVTITEPSAVGGSASSTPVSCNGGSNGTATAAPSGGTPGYTYLWSNGATTQTATGLSAGTYTVTITDNNGCSVIRTTTVSQPTALAGTASSTAVSCNGGSDGTASVSASGGTAPYTYLWNNGATTATASGLSAGNYTATITDANGCTIVRTTTVSQPTALTATSVATSIIVNGGTATVTVSASGGTAPYTGTGTFVRTAGTYTFIVTDANGCTASTTITLNEPDALVPTATAPPILCFGGSTTVTVTATGGVPPYTGTGTFVRTAGTYSFVVTDANGITATANITITEPTQLVASSSATAIACNGGNSTVTVTATGGTPAYTGTGTFTRTAGTYNFTVTDANGCTAITSVTITQPTALAGSASSTSATCNGGSTGSAIANITGGTPPYTYLWSNGATTQTATGLAAGTYTATLTDANGCTFTTTTTVTQPAALTVNSTQTPILCFGQSSTVTISATGGTAPYTGTGTFTRTAGTYTFVVTDDNGCTGSKQVVINQPSAVQVQATANQTTGELTASATGGTPPYTYLWNTGATSAVITGLVSGTYTVTVTDANGCTAIATVTLQLPDCDGFRTQTQGGWGSWPNGVNPGTYVKNNFALAFTAPHYLTVGCTRKLKLTTWQAVRDFLPSSGTPRALPPGTLTNPGATYANTLAGQVVALTLSVVFDQYDTDFSPAGTLLRNLVVASGPFAGMTVQQVLDEANRKLGGCSSSYSFSQLNNAVTKINQNFTDGLVDNGYLLCPDDIRFVDVAPWDGIRTEVHPNPFNDFTNIFIHTAGNLPDGSRVVAELFAIDGRLVNRIFDATVEAGSTYSLKWDGTAQAEGMYMLRVVCGDQVKTQRIVLSKY